jgi:hypothetical protein
MPRAGGMGGVHRARDSRPKRDVAIVSARQFSERFEREARAGAALNHPTCLMTWLPTLPRHGYFIPGHAPERAPAARSGSEGQKC